MHRCDDEPERYYFQTRCYDGVPDCLNREDENSGLTKCAGITDPWTTIPIDLCYRVTIAGTKVYNSIKGTYVRMGYNVYNGEIWPYFKSQNKYLYIASNGRWHINHQLDSDVGDAWAERINANQSNGKCPAAETNWRSRGYDTGDSNVFVIRSHEEFGVTTDSIPTTSPGTSTTTPTSTGSTTTTSPGTSTTGTTPPTSTTSEPLSTSTATGSTTISPDICSELTIDGTKAWYNSVSGTYIRMGYTDYDDESWPYFKSSKKYLYIASNGKWYINQKLGHDVADAWTERLNANSSNGKCPAAETDWSNKGYDIGNSNTFVVRTEEEFSVTDITTTSTTTSTTTTSTTTTTTTTTTTPITCQTGMIVVDDECVCDTGSNWTEDGDDCYCQSGMTVCRTI